MRINVAVLTATGVLFLAFAPVIVGWFTRDPAVQAAGTWGLRVISLGFPLYALGMVFEQSFNGAGDTRTPTWINFIAFWLVQIPLAWVLASPVGMDERGVFTAVPIAYTVLAVISVVLFRRGRWKTKYV